jgi:hypothetical protein
LNLKLKQNLKTNKIFYLILYLFLLLFYLFSFSLSFISKFLFPLFTQSKLSKISHKRKSVTPPDQQQQPPSAQQQHKYFTRSRKSIDQALGIGPSKMSISHQEESSLCQEILDLELSDNFNAVVAQVEYQGFSVAAVHKHMKQKCPTANNLSEDLNFILAFFAIRGTNVTKQLNRTEPEAAKKLEKLIKDYGITTTRYGVTIGKDVVTPGRLLQSYAPFIQKMMIAGYGRLLIPDYVGIDRMYQFFGASSLIKSDDLYTKWLAWATEADKIINGARANADNVKKFGDIARANSKWNKTRDVVPLIPQDVQMVESSTTGNKSG